MCSFKKLIDQATITMHLVTLASYGAIDAYLTGSTPITWKHYDNGGVYLGPDPKDEFIRAAKYGNREYAESLLDRYGNELIYFQDDSGRTGLMLASLNGHEEFTQSLLKRDNSYEYIDCQDDDGNTALILAAAYGHKEIIKLLIQSGASVDHQNKQGKTAVQLAGIECWNLDVLENEELRDLLTDYELVGVKRAKPSF